MRLPSPMGAGARFATIPRINVPRSQFQMNHGHTTTFDVGRIIPITWIDILPGDTVNLKATLFMRLSTPVKPLMDNLFADIHFFFVPYRLVWENFTKMMGEQVDPGDSIAYTVPQRAATGGSGFAAGTLEDYLGVPTGVDDSVSGWSISALPVRAYFKIWNDWYRDENLQDSSTGFATDDGPQNTTSGTDCLRRGKRHDYFTTCLPWLQKGTAIDIGGTIDSSGTLYFTGETSGQTGYMKPKTAATTADVAISSGGTAFTANEPLDYSSGLTFDAPTINELREALAIQKLLERSARTGTRYPEILAGVFGVIDPMHAVLQRSEFLGSATCPIIINPIAQTNATESGTYKAADTEQGNLSGIGTGVLRGSCYKSFTEHGIFMGLVSVRSDLRYQQGLERYWNKETRYDFYVPDLAMLGEQAVYNKEIYLQNHADDDAVFGYQERWSEYRYKQSRISGEFRSNHANTLEVWHLGLDFAACPTLNSTFIQENPDMARVLASSTNDHILCDSWFQLQMARPLPMYSIPGLGSRL